MAISIDFLANASRFLRGTEDTQQALEKVGTSLDDVARDGEQSNARLGASFRELAQNVQRTDLGGHVGTSMRRGAKESNEAIDTVRENTASNLKEVAASFDGTAAGISSGIQGLVAEVLEGFGPAGLIAGAVAAGGIGLIASGIQANDEKTQAWQQDVATLTQTLIDAASAQQQMSEQITGFATQSDRAKVSLADIRQQATDLDVPFRRLAEAYAAGGDPLQNILAKTNDMIEAQQQLHQQQQAAVGQNATLLSGEGARTRSLEAQRQKIIDLQKETGAARKAEHDWLAAGGADLQRHADALDTFASSVQSSLQDAGADWKDYTTDQGVNLRDYNKHLEDSIEATENYKTNVKRATKTLSEDALDYILSLGEDAAPLLQEYVDAPNKLKDRTAANWDRLGRQSSDAYKAALEDGLPKTIQGPKVVLDLDIPSVVTDAQSYLDSRPLILRYKSSPDRPGTRTG